MERCRQIQTNRRRRSQSHIPNDLSFSILSKLPIKSLKRFGCVHKSWSLLLDNPYFMTMYHYHFVTKDHSYYDHHNTSLLLHQETFELSSVYGKGFKNMVKLDWPNIKVRPVYQGLVKCHPGFRLLGSGSVHGILYTVGPIKWVYCFRNKLYRDRYLYCSIIFQPM